MLTASCVRPAENGMVVSHQFRPRWCSARRTLVELLMADHPSPCARQRQTRGLRTGDAGPERKASATPRFAKRLSPRGQDDSSFAIAVDHEACILCDRCIRGCDEIRHNNVLGRRGKGYQAGIAFDLNLPMGNSSCVSCGECMVSCPTGALTNESVVQTAAAARRTGGCRRAEATAYFEKVSGTFLELNKNAVVRRHVQGRRDRVPRRRVRLDRVLYRRREGATSSSRRRWRT